MKHKTLFRAVLAIFLIGTTVTWAQETATEREHREWVAGVISSIQTIRPGMTRSDLSGLFTTEGGLSNRLHRVFVLKQCPYINVQIEFEAVGEEQNILVERLEDKIVKISDPFLQFSVMD